MRLYGKDSRDSVPVNDQDEFVFPLNLFQALQDSAAVLWTCVRSMPRWEKKLCRILRSQMIPHYLPVVVRRTFSGRKLRSSSIPLFPGFVFVKGGHTKGSLKAPGCIANVLKPVGQIQIEELDNHIRAIRRMLVLGMPVGLTAQYEIGEKLTIASGPLRGVSGTVASTANARRLVLWIDILGVGATVQLSRDTILWRLDVV